MVGGERDTEAEADDARCDRNRRIVSTTVTVMPGTCVCRHGHGRRADTQG